MPTALIKKLTSTKGAIFDSTETYRYWLWRYIGNGSGTVNFIMLNPSTATHEEDDPTIRRCMGYAKDWGFSDLVVTNLFALRSVDPKALYSHPDPCGPDNGAEMIGYARNAKLVVCAWGCHGKVRGASAIVGLRQGKCHPHYLKLTKDGIPSHPLYLKSDLKPQKFFPEDML